jgi:hypothetical protein
LRPVLPTRLLFLFLPFVFAVATACGGDAGQRTSDVAGSVPWPDSESLTYAVKDKRGADLGKIVLAVDGQGSNTKLSQRFEGQSTRDDTTVVVNGTTLKPVSSSREITTARDKERIEVTYTPNGALIKQGDEKQSGLSVPEHAYDNDSSLFLWRTLKFEPGYKASYVSVITNRRTRQTVHLEVIGKETVRVPAGAYEAWKLQVKAKGVTQLAWYADTAARPLVRYDNDNGLIYELESNR